MATSAKLLESVKSFAQALSGAVSGESLLSQLPPKVVMGDSVHVKISQAAYESGLAACKCNLHGRLTLHKGDSPLTTQTLKAKLNNLWPQLRNWNLIPLGKGFFEFNFSTIEDMSWIFMFLLFGHRISHQRHKLRHMLKFGLDFCICQENTRVSKHYLKLFLD